MSAFREVRHGTQQGAVSTRPVGRGVRAALWNRGKMPRGAFLLALARRLRVSGVRGHGALRAGEAWTVAVQRLPTPDVADGGYDLRGHQARSDGVVPRHVPHDSNQAGHLGA